MKTYNVDKQFKKFWRVSHAKDVLFLKMMRFLKTKNGQSFVNNLHRYSLKELSSMYGINLMILNNSKDIYTVIDKAVTCNNMRPTPGAPYKAWNVPQKRNYRLFLTTGRQPLVTVHTPLYKYSTRTGKMEDYGWDIKYRNISDVGLLENKRTYWKYEYFRDYTKRLIEHKMAKWERKNPRPTVTVLKHDLFPGMLIEAWGAKEKTARKYIQNLVKEKYDKTSIPVIGRVKDKEGTYQDKIVSWIEDPHNNIRHVNESNYMNNELVLSGAKELLNYSMTNKLVCGYIQNRARTLGRVLTMDMIHRIAA